VTNFEIVKNQRNGENLIHENQIYNKDTRTKTGNLWRCMERKCKVTGFIDSNGVFLFTGIHEHGSKEHKILKTTIMRQVTKCSNESGFSNFEIVTKLTKNLNEEQLKYIPKFKKMMDKCTKVKNKDLNITKKTCDDIPDFLKRDLQNEKFLQFDKGVGSNDRYIIFGSEKFKKHISKVTTVLIDGTFWSVPSEFHQLVTLCCCIFGKYYPLGFILMSYKKEESYFEAFFKCKEIFNCNFENIILILRLHIKIRLKRYFLILLYMVVDFIMAKTYGDQFKSLVLQMNICIMKGSEFL
jgi:hypothetical protein